MSWVICAVKASTTSADGARWVVPITCRSYLVKLVSAVTCMHGVATSPSLVVAVHAGPGGDASPPGAAANTGGVASRDLAYRDVAGGNLVAAWAVPTFVASQNRHSDGDLVLVGGDGLQMGSRDWVYVVGAFRTEDAAAPPEDGSALQHHAEALATALMGSALDDFASCVARIMAEITPLDAACADVGSFFENTAPEDE